MVDFVVRTIEELEALYYTQRGANLLGMTDLVAEFVTKADSPVTTATTGVYNPIYGAAVWAQLNMEMNAFGAIPKTPWHRSGWRIITARSAQSTYSAADAKYLGAAAEGGAIPDAEPPTFAQLVAKPKTVAHAFSVSEIQNELGNLGADDVTANMEALRAYFSVEHKEAINRQLLFPLPLPDPSETNTPPYKARAVESIDRIVASCAEATAMNAGNASKHADPYTSANSVTGQITRSSSSDHGDSVVLSGGTMAATAGDITDDLIVQLMNLCRHKGAEPTFWLTGWDTYGKIQGLYAPEVRYTVGSTYAAMSVNGVKTDVGEHAGMKVSTLYGLPVIISKDAPKSYSGVTYSARSLISAISNLYLLDTSNPEGHDYPRLFFKTLKPTQYFEAGMSTGLPFAINALADKGMFRTAGELTCHRFNVQGKLRDLK